MIASHPCHTFSFEHRPPLIFQGKTWQAQALINLSSPKELKATAQGKLSLSALKTLLLNVTT